MIKNVLLCGIGAVGLTFACKLQDYSPECLKVLVDEERLRRYTEKPLKMNGEERFFDYMLPSATDYKADLVIIATKMDGLDAVLKNLRNFVGENTIILPVLNGISAEEKVAEVYGWERTLYGYFIGHSAMRVGNEVIQDGVGKIVFGGVPEAHPQLVTGEKLVTDLRDKEASVVEFFIRAGIDFDKPQNIRYAKWLKYGLNIISNQSSCILKLTFGDMQKSAEFHSFAHNILQEVVALARAEGVEGWQNLEEDVFKALGTMVADGRTSMWQDIDAGKKTELDIFAGTVIKLGKKHGIPTPYNQVLYEMIRILEEKA